MENKPGNPSLKAKAAGPGHSTLSIMDHDTDENMDIGDGLMLDQSENHRSGTNDESNIEHDESTLAQNMESANQAVQPVGEETP